MASEKDDDATTLDATADPAEGDDKGSEGGEVNGTINYKSEYQKYKDRDTEFGKRDADLKTREGRVLKSEDLMLKVDALGDRMSKDRDADRTFFSEIFQSGIGAIDPGKAAEVASAIEKTNKGISERSTAATATDSERVAISKSLAPRIKAAGIDTATDEKYGELAKGWTAEAQKQEADGHYSSLPYYRLAQDFGAYIDFRKDETATAALKASEAEADATKKELANAVGEDDLSTGGRSSGGSNKLEGMTATQKIEYSLNEDDKVAARA
jgi:hypothetical protein